MESLESFLTEQAQRWAEEITSGDTTHLEQLDMFLFEIFQEDAACGEGIPEEFEDFWQAVELVESYTGEDLQDLAMKSLV